MLYILIWDANHFYTLAEGIGINRGIELALSVCPFINVSVCCNAN